MSNPDWSVRQIEERVKSYKPKAQKQSSASKAISGGDDLKIVRKALQEFFGTKQVTIKYGDKTAKSGSFTVKFNDQEELEHMYKAVE